MFPRISKEEEDKGGLVILYAAYGLLVNSSFNNIKPLLEFKNVIIVLFVQATDGGDLKPEFKNIDSNSEENSR